MSRFGEQCEDLKQQTNIMDSSVITSNASSVPQDEVDRFLRDIATEHQISTNNELESIAGIKPSSSVESQIKLSKDEEKELEERLAKLRG